MACHPVFRSGPAPFSRRRFWASATLALALTDGVKAADPIRDVGKITAEWIQTRGEINRVENAWTQDQVWLNSTLTALKEQKERLQEKRDRLFAATAEERAELANLNTKLAAAKDSLQVTEARLQKLTEQILRLRPRLPPRLSEALEMSYRTLAAKESSPGERMQVAMTVLNRCAQFNLSIDQGDEILTLPGETSPKSLEVVYWGLSHGYALDRPAGKAWLGTPGPDGWRWEALDGAAPAVAALLAIRRDDAEPRLVMVPTRLEANPAAR